MLYSFRLALPRYRIERLLDPITSYFYASQINPNSHVLHIPANLVRLCYYCSPLSPYLVCMLGCYQLLPPVTPWIGLSHYYIVVDDMIIIMLTIFDEGWKVSLSRLGALFHSSHLGSEFWVLVLRLSVPNRVCDFMGSPLLTYLASNISRGGPS